MHVLYEWQPKKKGGWSKRRIGRAPNFILRKKRKKRKNVTKTKFSQ